jgi:putative tricarboxylic transport membrane protein
MNAPGLPRRHLLGAVSLLALPGLARDAVASDDPSLGAAECVIPARAGGGFELTCALAGDALQTVRPSRPPLARRPMPGGIGALAFDQVASGRLGGDGLLVAFSSGSLLNLAQGRFGAHSAADVRWVATLGTDYGVVVVHRDSPLRTLQDLLAALRRRPSDIVFGAGGTVGSQDWVKAALLTRHAGHDPRAMRFVAFEGGGDALRALQGRHVDVFPGDAAEALQAIAGGAALRLLAVLSYDRLDAALAGVPTAREQSVDLVWPTVRGLYASAGMSDAARRAWARAFDEAMQAATFPALLRRHRLYPHALTGAALDGFVAERIAGYRRLADELGLRRWAR